MATTIDHLRVDHRVTILRDFTDLMGTMLKAGEWGILRALSFDQIQLEIRMEIERERGRVVLRFPLRATHGPRNGHMKEFFELGEFVPAEGSGALRLDGAARVMRVPPPEIAPVANGGRAWSQQAQDVDGPDRLEEIERRIQREIQHIGAAASIAEMYAQRMRMFQRLGNEPRAVVAFKLALQWMGTYASWATSGGEGAALSLERDQFHAALVREFGYDPSEPIG